MASIKIFQLVFSTIFFHLFFVSIVDATKYTANGTIYCHENEPLNGVKVELYEWDPIRDDFLGRAMTNKNGRFWVSGKESEVGNEQPYLWILHRCADEEIKKGCLFYESRLYFKGDFSEYDYLFQVNVNLINGTAEVDGKTYPLETKKC